MQRTISRYVLLEQAGSTGLATVYRAQDPNQERVVALKVLRPYMCADESLIERFSQEMELVARLDHPNILPVYGKENEGDIHWVAMQYVSWPTLRQWLQQPIPAAQAIVILRQVAEAIEAAQREGINHGDVKPGNIFLDPETGQVLLSDFGIVMLADGTPLGIRAALNTPLPTYTAPEQGQGSSPSARSDIYSLGVLAYDMLTGTVPFNALERASVQVRQLTSVPPLPSLVNPNLPPQLDAIILKALAPHPERRYETPGELVRALAEAAPVPESASLPFPVLENREVQRTFPGLGSVEAAPLIDDGPAILCTVCGHSNVSYAEWCAECWGVLDRVAAAPGEKVVPTEERERRRKRNSRIRRAIVGTTAAVAVTVLAVQFLNITPPLSTPSSTISSESGPGEWAMIHRSFTGPGLVPGESAAIKGRVRWKFETSEPLVSTPAVKGGRVYLTTQDKRVVALDEATGSLIWEYQAAAPIDSSPAVAGDLVIFGGRNKRVIALDADTGEERWEFVTEANPTRGSPIVQDGVVYIGSGDSNIYALDALTGEKLWDHATNNWITNTPALSGHLLVVSSLDGRVTIYDTDTGKRRFTFRGISRDVLGSPIIVGDSVYVPYQNGFLYSVNLKEKEVLFQSRLYRIKIQLYLWDMMGSPGFPKGVQWSVRLGGSVQATPAADEDNIYVSTRDGRVIAMDRLTGRKLWTFKSGSHNLSTPTIVEHLLLVGDEQGQVHAVDLGSGEEQWVLQIAEGAISTPVVAGGTLYLASKDGTLYAVE